ncbi:MAG: hypothetical protein WKF66_02235 [Pedobacter sp.]
MNIVITGLIGHIGKPLTKELIMMGHTVIIVNSKIRVVLNVFSVPNGKLVPFYHFPTNEMCRSAASMRVNSLFLHFNSFSVIAGKP